MKTIVLAALLLVTSAALQAQIANSARAVGHELDLSGIPQVQPEAYNAEQHAAEVAGARIPVYGRFLPLAQGGLEHGRWTETSSGDGIWQLRISSPGALATELHFSEFDLPPGASLFVLDADGRQVLGGYDAEARGADGLFSTGLVHGESCIVEYQEPAAFRGQGRVRIDEVGHAFRMMGSSDAERADFCQVDVNCSEGSTWTEQRDASVRIGVRLGNSSYWCSGTLVNNTAQDCKPYFLTAKHCGMYPNDANATTADYNQWRFYFRYQRPSCGTGTAPTSYSVLGCTERGDSEDLGGNNGSDFLLLEANNETIPTSYNPYWAGWDANPTTSTGGRGIHHPAGDEKKISTFTGTTVSAAWGTSGTHWRVIWTATANGHGVTEGGSSGSALFNNQKRIIGTLTGGLSCCVNNGCDLPGSGPGQPDYYGKMSHHWTGNPNGITQKLRYWLDPGTTGALVLNGSYSPCTTTAVAETEAVRSELVPNPTTREALLMHPAGMPVERIEVFDVSGRRVLDLAADLSDRTLIDLGGRPAGTYLVRVRSQDGSSRTERLMLMAP